MIELIQKLVEVWGPSGFEHHVRELIRAEVADLADEIRVDALGNLICRVGEGDSKVMIAAHMDEIGVMVSHIDDNGFLRFANIGGVNQQNLHGLRVQFEDGTVGVLSAEATDRSRVPGLSSFYIDVDTGEGESSIKVGDPAVFWRQLDVRGQRAISKAMDDRIGCVVAIETMKRLKETQSPHEVYFVFTVQEEVGLRGATTSGYSIYPDLAIALDVTLTGDTPKGSKMDVKLGAGAAIKAKDGRHIVSPAVKKLMVDAAEKNNIPYQIEILTGGTTDAAAIQTAQAGVPSGTISIPCRYVHSPSETVDLGDVKACVDLLTAIVTNSIEGVRPE